MGAGENGRWVVQVKVRGLPWWGVYGSYQGKEIAERVKRRVKGWYKATRVVDSNEIEPIDMIDACGNPCGAVRAVR